MLFHYFKVVNDLQVSKDIGTSVWIFPIVQAFHLVALAIFAGAVLVVDLRLMGRGLKDRPLRQVTRDAQPWLIWGFVGLLATGIPQLMQNALREYYSIFFWIKMDFLGLALIWMFTVRRTTTQGDETQMGAFRLKAVGLVSILLWLGVAVPARLIGLFS